VKARILLLVLACPLVFAGCEELGIELPEVPNDVGMDVGDAGPDVGDDADVADTDTEDAPDSGVSCFADSNADGVPDVYPETGPVSAGDYSACGPNSDPAVLTYFPEPLCTSERWKYVFETRGVAAGGNLYVLDNAGGNDNEDFWWHEEHPLELDDKYPYGTEEPGGWWQRYAIVLPKTDDFNAQSSGENTFMSCEARASNLIWGVTLHDEQNNQVDCLILASSPNTRADAGDIAEVYPELAGCDVFRWQGIPEPLTCAEDNDLDGRPDVFPESGPVSDGDYAACPDYRNSAFATYIPQPQCDQQEWSFEVETLGAADAIVLYALDTAGGSDNSTFWWGERHELGAPAPPAQQYGPGGWWSRFELTLPVTDDFSAQQPSVNSFLSCSSNNGVTLVWGLEVFEDGEVVDCVTIGESETTEAWIPDLESEFPQLTGCETLSGWPQ
jgi:hypothetical protein